MATHTHNLRSRVKAATATPKAAKQPPIEPLHFLTGFLTRKGDNRADNQDSYVIGDTKAPITVFGVLDGHGPLGHKASQDAAQILPEMILKHVTQCKELTDGGENLSTDVKTALATAFAYTQEQLLAAAQATATNVLPALDYGTTAVLGVFFSQKHYLVVGNVGDSRALHISWELLDKGAQITQRRLEDTIIQPIKKRGSTEPGANPQVASPSKRAKAKSECDGSESTNSTAAATTAKTDTTFTSDASQVSPAPLVIPLLGSTETSGKGWKVLSMEHSAHLHDKELERLKALNANIRMMPSGTYRVLPGPGHVNTEPYKNLALSMTRALGHIVLSQYGVLPEPDFIITKVKKDDRVVFASDGLWNVLTNDEVAEVVLNNDDPQKSCIVLVREAKRRYQAAKAKSDDITVVVVHFTDKLPEQTQTVATPPDD